MPRRSKTGPIGAAPVLGVLLALLGLEAQAAGLAAASHPAAPAGGHAGGRAGGHGGARGGGAHGRTYTTYIFTTVRVPGSPQYGHGDDWLSADQMKDLALQPLIADGTPMAVNVGALTVGEAFFHVGVKHGITGVLKADVTLSKWLLHRTLPAGQPVYGIPMAGTNDAAIVWCAPQLQPAKDAVRHWTTICLPLGDSGYVALESRPAMMTAKLNWQDGAGRQATPPVVDRVPVDFPPMTLSYVFGGWTREGWLTVEVQLDWGEGPQVLRTISLPPDSDGNVIVKAMGGRLAVHAVAGETAKAASDATVAVQLAPLPGAPIAY